MSRQTLANILSDEIRPSSVPPSRISSVNKASRTQSIPPSRRNHFRTASGSQLSKDSTGVNPLDLMDFLQRSEPSVVKTRSGSVLSRGFILKTDHYPSGVYSFFFVDIVSNITMVGRALDLDLNVHGAPNFRSPRQDGLNVFGVAQPRIQGLQAILSILRCRPNTSNPSHVVWFSTREEPIGMSVVSEMFLSERYTKMLIATSIICTHTKKKHILRTYIDFLLFSPTQFIFLVVHLSYVTRLNHDLHFQFLIVPKISKQSKID